MKKIFLTIAFIATGLVASAQVGIGNTDPKTTLHVTGTNAAGTGELAAADGVTVPRVVTDMRDDATVAPADGVEIGQLVYSTNAASTGFWYWAGATDKWNPLVSAAAPVFSSVIFEKNSSYTALNPADLTGQINTLVFTGSAPANFTITGLGAGDVGKMLVIYNGSATNIAGSFFRAGDGAAASVTMNGTLGRSFIWAGDGWARMTP